jgi:hypothetical protein
MASDLTFQQLSEALPVGAITAAANTVTINVGLVTGDAYAAITATGVVEALSKLLRAGQIAQASANETALAGEALAAFGVGSLGALETLADGTIQTQVNYSLSTILKLDANNAVGPVA